MIRESYSNKVVLVTGGAGFIGSHLVDRLIKDGVKQVIVIDNLFLGSLENLKSAQSLGAIFYNEDIESKDALEYIFDLHEIDIVFNLATKALNYSFINPANAFTTNVNGVVNLLELQRKGRFTTLCHCSTSEVYGTAVYEPMDEQHPKSPMTTYAAGKAAADFAVESYVSMFDLDSFVVRPFNNFGPRQNYKGLLAAVIPITAWRLCNGKQPEIHGEGAQTRDFIYVHDTVDAIVKLFSVMPKGESANISTDNSCSIKSLIESICLYFDYQGEILVKEARGADVLAHKASNEKIRGLIDYELTPFDESLEQTLKWYSEGFTK